MAQITLIRNKQTSNSTTGDLLIDGEYFCETLEDITREIGVKVLAKTAIPAGQYKWRVTFSPRFKRKMILIYNQPDYSLSAGGISFIGIRIHGGNTHLNTDGCVLVAYKHINPDLIQGTAEKELTAWAINAGSEGTIEIINQF